MPATPGRPYDPTLHPRTKPEANDYALKNRATSDWFRHDGKNIEPPAPVPVRLATKQANEIAVKSRGLPPDQWFEHDPNAPIEPHHPQLKCKTDSARRVLAKVYGKDEPWFKHDENVDFYGDSKPDRVSSQSGADIKHKYEDATKTTMNWYRHDHGPDDDYRREVPKSRTGPLPAAMENKMKLQSTHGTSNLFNHSSEPDPDAWRAKSRLTTKDAEEYYQRDQCAGEWFEHDDRVQDVACPGPRVMTQEGQDNALKNGSVSDTWYTHDNNGVADQPKPRSMSEASKKHQGGEMQRILRMEGRPPADTSGHARAVKPEVKEFAHRSVHGVMDQVLDHSASQNYDEPRPAPRAIKPEAEMTFQRNKGVMGECFQGYFPPPLAKTVHKARPVDDCHIEKHTGSVMDKTIKGELPASGRGHAARTIKPEAEDNAERNKGSMKQVMIHQDHFDAAPAEQKKGRGLMTEAAQEIARKYHGTVNNLIS